MLELFSNSKEENKIINKLFINYLVLLAKCSDNMNKYKLFYNECIANLNTDVVNLIADNTVTYDDNNIISIKAGKTISEILYILHQRIINNKQIFEDMPHLKRKELDNGSIVSLYGYYSLLGDALFYSMNNDLSLEKTNILSLDERCLLIINNNSQTWSIEIKKDNEKYYIFYSIPNNNLDDTNQKHITGVFESTGLNIIDDLTNFIFNLSNHNKSLN